ncbi:MAG: caspase family protein [Sediminibacterium sp.]|nr:caspase family protein [Sediminibacterium sp.]
MSKMYRHFIWILIVSTSHFAMAGISIPKKGKVYLINIGVNQNIGYQYCLYCDNDVDAMKVRLEADSANHHFALEIYNFTNEQATFANINKTFGYIAENATKYDKIMLYYSGVTLPIETRKGAPLINYFLLANAKRVGKDIEGDFFTIGTLKTWLDRIAASDFLLISDAGPTDTYIKDFLENLTYINSDWQGIDDKNRIFLFPNIAGYDNRKSQRGYFSEILTGLPEDVSLIDLLDSRKKEAIFTDLKTVENILFRNNARAFTWSLKMFEEKAFINDYSFLLKNNTTKKSRGLEEEEELDAEIDLDSARKPRQLALVIGVNNYLNYNQLNNPILDANTLGDVLKEKYGFEIWRLTDNPTLSDITKMIGKLKQEQLNGPYDRFVLFFAGHGYVDESTGTGHLVASDSKKQKEDSKFETVVQHNYLINELEKLNCKHVLLVIDACYSGSIQKAIDFKDNDDCNYTIPINWKNLYGKISDEQYIKRNIACPTRRYITSGGSKYTVPDGVKGKHSPFAAYFIDKLTKGDPTDGIVSYTEFLPDLGRITPKPRQGRFGNDSETSEFMFIAKQ